VSLYVAARFRPAPSRDLGAEEQADGRKVLLPLHQTIDLVRPPPSGFT
jgi:hypothetical protein